MRRPFRSQVWAAAGAALVLAATGDLARGESQPQQRPPEERVVAVYTHYESPPRTAQAGFDSANTVLHVLVKQSRPGESHLGQGIRIRTIEHVAEVREVLKGAGIAEGTIVRVAQDIPSQIDGVKHEGTRNVLEVEKEYVLFLDQPLHSDAYRIAWGDGGVFALSSESVRVSPLAARMWQLRSDVSRSEFLGTLRAFKAKASGKH